MLLATLDPMNWPTAICWVAFWLFLASTFWALSWSGKVYKYEHKSEHVCSRDHEEEESYD